MITFIILLYTIVNQYDNIIIPSRHVRYFTSPDNTTIFPRVYNRKNRYYFYNSKVGNNKRVNCFINNIIMFYAHRCLTLL